LRSRNGVATIHGSFFNSWNMKRGHNDDGRETRRKNLFGLMCLTTIALVMNLPANFSCVHLCQKSISNGASIFHLTPVHRRLCLHVDLHVDVFFFHCACDCCRCTSSHSRPVPGPHVGIMASPVLQTLQAYEHFILQTTQYIWCLVALFLFRMS